MSGINCKNTCNIKEGTSWTVEVVPAHQQAEVNLEAADMPDPGQVTELLNFGLRVGFSRFGRDLEEGGHRWQYIL